VPLAQGNLPDGHAELYVLLALAGIVVLACVFVLVRRAHLTAVRAEQERVRRASGEQPPL
jgi:heme exporter protein D